MKATKYAMSQAFSLVISILLVFVFFLLMIAGFNTGDNLTIITNLLLIVIAITMLSIFGMLNQISTKLKR